jgi:tRNA wybutosine-synthesizing protein 2
VYTSLISLVYPYHGLVRAKFLGDIALVKITRHLEGVEDTIARKIMARYPHVRSVIGVYSVSGKLRTPIAHLIAGDPNTETTHREYECQYKLDALKLMFSLGNSWERIRISQLVSAGETVVDMFAGVGQFTIPIAVKAEPGKIYSFELNPDAYRYLLENIRLNHVEEKVIPIMDDCRRSLSYGLEGKADRVVMGYYRGTLEYLPYALKLIKQTGGFIHFHELAERGVGWEKLLKSCGEVAGSQGYSVRLNGFREVKTYSPKLSHWVLDLYIFRELPLKPSSCLAQNLAP